MGKKKINDSCRKDLRQCVQARRLNDLICTSRFSMGARIGVVKATVEQIKAVKMQMA